MKKENKTSSNRGWLEWYESMVFALVFLVLLFTFVIRIAAVRGSSMVPTLYSGDRIVLQQIGYKPKRGDIVVVDDYIDYGDPLVKRIIAMGGDTVDINFVSGDVWVNGNLLHEPYILDKTKLKEGVEFPVTVPEGKVFLMGDNRMGSKDSRDAEIGFIDERDILGRGVFRIFPLNKIGAIH